jgi:Ca-activated chloride channel family protein
MIKRFVLLLMLALPCLGGTITGTVAVNDVALPGASVTLFLTDAPRSTWTDAEGHFTFLGVPSGTWKIRAELSGLSPIEQTVAVTETNTISVNFAMHQSVVSQTITVVTRAPEVFTTSEVVATMSGGETYTSIVENKFIDAAKHRLSTFSIDVDTASYSMVRRTIGEGKLPEPDEVRVEEMVNYFTYSYPEPADGKPFSVTTEVAGAPWNTSHRLMRIGIRGTKLAPWQMKPCNLVFLLDTSGSMDSPERLPLLKKAFRMLVEQLRAEDRVAIVAYAGSAGLVLPSTSGADKPRIYEALESLDAGGSTAGGAGIVLAYDVAKQNFIQEGVNRVILATDGDFNVGVADGEELTQLIEEKRKDDIELSVIGVGEGNRKDAKMELLADKGNGNYSYVDSLLEARKVFVDQIGGTLVTIAKDVKLQLDFDPKQVASYRLIGYENRMLEDKDFDDDAKDAGELGSGHTVTAMYEIVPAPGASRGAVATLKLRYKPPHAWLSRLMSVRVNDDGRSAWEASDDLKFAASVAELGMLLRDSPHKGDSNFDDALQLAKTSRGADLEGYRAEFVKIVDQARALSAAMVSRK